MVKNEKKRKKRDAYEEDEADLNHAASQRAATNLSNARTNARRKFTITYDEIETTIETNGTEEELLALVSRAETLLKETDRLNDAIEPTDDKDLDTQHSKQLAYLRILQAV